MPQPPTTRPPTCCRRAAWLRVGCVALLGIPAARCAAVGRLASTASIPGGQCGTAAAAPFRPRPEAPEAALETRFKQTTPLLLLPPCPRPCRTTP